MRADISSRRGLVSIGERVELRRRYQHLSRRVVAELVGRSEEWLRLIETGRLRLDSIQAAVRLAEVLHMNFDDLVDCQVPEARRATAQAQDLIAVFEPVLLGHIVGKAYPDSCQGDIDQQGLIDGVDRCEKIWISATDRYVLLAQYLPRLLAICHARCWHDDFTGTRFALSRLLHLSREILTCIGAHDLAVLVADRALTVSYRIDSRQLVSASRWHWAAALLQLEKDQYCYDFALDASDGALLVGGGGREDAVLHGALRLLAAKASAGSDPGESARLLAAAQQLASGLGADRYVLGIGFGPNEISLTRMEIALLHGDFNTVIDVAARVDPEAGLPVNRRARYFIVLAAAYASHREIVSAAFALIQAAETCADDLRYDHDAHVALRSIIESRNRLLGPKIAYLAELAGVGSAW